MKRSTLVLALAGLTLIPALGSAQERRTREERSRAEHPVRTRLFTYSNRARLGVSVTIKADPESDKYGAKIQSVIPDGPADKAGLKAGDVVTRFNGTSLANAESDEEGQSGAGLKLIELARALDPGDSVKIEYRRDGQNHTATVVAAEIEPMTFAVGGEPFKTRDFAMTMPRFEGPEGGVFKFEPGHEMSLFFENEGHGLDLVELNADLGEYFGTSEGLLVTRTPEDSSTALRAGDVILSIDGRKPTSEAQARRILGSYEEGETAKLEIMRKRQRMTVDWQVDRPEFKTRHLTPGHLERTERM